MGLRSLERNGTLHPMVRLLIFLIALGVRAIRAIGRSRGNLIIENSREAMLAEIRSLPAGQWHYTMRIDGYDEPVDIACAVTIGDSGIDIAFDGTSPVSAFGINVPLTYTQAYASFGARCVIGNDIPNNAGSLGVVRVTAPAGSILNAPRPCAVSARHAIGQMLPDVVLGCLEQPLGGRVPVEGAACLFGPVFLGGRGVVPGSTSDPFVINMFYAGGTGARPDKDGLSCTAFPSGVRSTPVEITENAAPLVMWRKEFLPASGAAENFVAVWARSWNLRMPTVRHFPVQRCLTGLTTRPVAATAAKPARRRESI